MPPSDDPLTRLRAFSAAIPTGVVCVHAEDLAAALDELDRLRDLAEARRIGLDQIMMTIAHEALTESGVQRAAR